MLLLVSAAHSVFACCRVGFLHDVVAKYDADRDRLLASQAASAAGAGAGVERRSKWPASSSSTAAAESKTDSAAAGDSVAGAPAGVPSLPIMSNDLGYLQAVYLVFQGRSFHPDGIVIDRILAAIINRQEVLVPLHEPLTRAVLRDVARFKPKVPLTALRALVHACT